MYVCSLQNDSQKTYGYLPCDFPRALKLPASQHLSNRFPQLAHPQCNMKEARCWDSNDQSPLRIKAYSGTNVIQMKVEQEHHGNKFANHKRTIKNLDQNRHRYHSPFLCKSYLDNEVNFFKIYNF